MIKKWDKKTLLTVLYGLVALVLTVTVCILLLVKFSDQGEKKLMTQSSTMSSSKSTNSEGQISIAEIGRAHV